jgi:hypothetical protein
MVSMMGVKIDDLFLLTPMLPRVVPTYLLVVYFL